MPSKTNHTSHFSAVLPLFLREEDGEPALYTRLVLYKNRYEDNQLELRVCGGTNEEHETPRETAEREMGQELGLSLKNSLADDLLPVCKEEQPDQENREGIHLKQGFITFNAVEAEGKRVHEPDIEGSVNVPFEKLIYHLAWGSSLQVGHSVDQRFHRKIIKQAALTLAKEFSTVREVVDKVGWT